MQKGGLGGRDRDLCVSCGGAATGGLTVHPVLAGTRIQDIVDKTGKRFGKERMQVAAPDAVAGGTCRWPRPGANATSVEKISFVAIAGSQICGVGHYRQRRLSAERRWERVSGSPEQFPLSFQANANQSPFAQSHPMSGGAELTPRAESGSEACLEIVPTGQGAPLIGQVLYRQMHHPRLPEREHPVEA